MEDLSLRRIVPTDRESATILVLLVAMVLGLGYIGLSLAFWGTPGWGSPDPIPHVGLGNQVLADIGMSSTGYGFAVWTQKWGDGYRVLAARFLPDSGWTVGRPVDEGIGNGKIAKLAVSDGGDALVVWTDRGFQGTLWANRFIAGRDWGSPELLSHDDFSRIYFDFHAALDPGGSGIVAWSQFEEDSTLGREVGRMYTKRFDPAAGWQARDALGTGLVSDVLLANDGTAVLAWSWSTFQNVSRHPAGGSWSPPAILNPGGSGSAHPRLCVLAGDHLLAVWPDERNGAYGLWSSTYASSSGWSAPQPVPSGPGTLILADLACTGRGDAVVLSSGYGGANLLANWFNEGTGWSSATPIRATGSGAQWARAAVDPAGRAFAVWWEENPSAAFVAQFTEDSTAVEARRLDSGAGGVGPEVAVDSEGNAIVAWGQGRYEASGVWVNRYIDPQSKVSRIPILPVTFVAMTGLVGTCATAWWWRRAVRPPRAEAAS